MFCSNCGKELSEGAKFCAECGAAAQAKIVPGQQTVNATKKPKSAGRKIVIISVIAASVIVLVLAIVLVSRIVKKNSAFEAELPELAPDSEEEYEALFDKLEYLTLGEDMASTDESDETVNAGDTIAEALSTTDCANAMDFEWLHDVMESDGTGAGIILDETQADPIPADDNSYLNGGWKAYMFGTDSDYGERYLNAQIEAQGDDFSITLNWKYFYLDGISYEENGSSTFSGQRSSADGVATAQNSSGVLELSEFYISKDREHEYALGAFQYPSGELFFLGLMR